MMSNETVGSRVLQGVVVSNKMDKTIVVKVTRRVVHERYGKIVTRSTKFHAHDQNNCCQIGDVVSIKETRPVSKTKSWELVERLEKLS
jgi:small subunit ribosomal protein S17